MKGKLRVAIQKGFNFLIEDFGFTLIDEKDDPAFYKLIYSKEEIGVDVYYETREQYIRITLYQLLDGKFINNAQSALKNNEDIRAFSLEFIIDTTNPEDHVLALHEYGSDSDYYKKDGLDLYVDLFVSRLEKYGSDILCGDFSSFSKLDSIYKERYS